MSSPVLLGSVFFTIFVEKEIMGKTKENKPKPFLKWAGGKSWLIPEFDRMIEGLRFANYIEPFIGGGAIFFHMREKYGDIIPCVINDINEGIINCYKSLQDKEMFEHLKKELEEAQDYYLKSDEEQNKERYYSNRDVYNVKNYGYNMFTKLWTADDASFFIQLNKTCFNGLYRVNRFGDFNVPFGKYKSPNIFDKDTLEADHKVLDSVYNVILNTNYKEVIEMYAVRGSLVYLDPPYRPLKGKGTSFNYTEDSFDDKCQESLKKSCDLINERGGYFILSNSDPHNTNPDDNFFDELYKGYNIQRIPSKRRISSKGNGRGEINELIIKNF